MIKSLWKVFHFICIFWDMFSSLYANFIYLKCILLYTIISQMGGCQVKALRLVDENVCLLSVMSAPLWLLVDVVNLARWATDGYFKKLSPDEKDGLAVSLKEASRLIEEAKEREVQMQNKLKTLEQQVQILNERDEEVCSELTQARCYHCTFLVF